ncbi:protein SPMIP7-like [Diadema antillarum]|uniref:protein SPMIP7-like n=1 Tax=Diadema antillarum TaxID=105358 RepID=UPI003A8AD163
MADTAVRPRPTGDLRLHLQVDTNAGPNNVQNIVGNRRRRLMKIPISRGRFDVASFQEPANSGFVKYNDDTLAPHRDNYPVIDPTSGFVSVAADVDRNTGIKGIPNLQQSDNPPNTVTPLSPRPTTTLAHREKEKVKENGKAAPNPLRFSAPSMIVYNDPQLKTTKVLNDPGTWNSRQISDAMIRAKLGGWTSDIDPRKTEKEQHMIWQQIHSKNIKNQSHAVDKAKDWKDEAALRYIYLPSTQRSYEDVNWDAKIAPKVDPPATTLERQPDQISHRFNVNKRYEPDAQEWQNLGRSFDWFQTRNGYHMTGPVEFCSPHRKNYQIPNYTAFIGGYGERDHPRQFFLPSAVMRTSLPWYTDTAHRPNIPGYTGCTHWRGKDPANANVPVPPPQTTARVHRIDRYDPNQSPFKRTSRMSKMVTLVPPCNPFNKVEKEERTLEQYR